MYETGERVEARIPGGVTVIGIITNGPTSQGGETWYVVESSSSADDGHRYDVRQDEIAVVLDSNS